MAELEQAPTTSSCCGAEQQKDCCDPSEKDECCSSESGGCGCAAREASAEDVREAPSSAR
jgi:hypothetical protein